jgi:putative oxidoreductase
MRVLGRIESQVYALFRIAFGLLFLMHGTQKFFNWPVAGPGALPAFLKIGGSVELICGFLVLIGFLGGLAAFVASGEMAFAYFMVHAKGGLWPIVNKGELAVLYCFAFLLIAAHGSGIWSVDSLRGRTRARSATA